MLEELYDLVCFPIPEISRDKDTHEVIPQYDTGDKKKKIEPLQLP